MERIIQLEEICMSLDDSQKLNNSVPSALAWVLNKYKVFPEFELKPVEKVVEHSHDSVLGLRFTKGKWELWNADVFASMDQVKFLIEQKEFYYAPLKTVNNHEKS